MGPTLRIFNYPHRIPGKGPALLRKALFGLDALAGLAEPRAMMLPGPTRRNPAARHRANRSFDPDPGVDVHDDGEDQDEREKGVQQIGDTNHSDGKEPREIDAPYHDAGEQQDDQADDQGEEQQFLPGIVTPDVGEVFLSISDHIVALSQPDPVARLQLIVAPELHTE